MLMVNNEENMKMEYETTYTQDENILTDEENHLMYMNFLKKDYNILVIRFNLTKGFRKRRQLKKMMKENLNAQVDEETIILAEKIYDFVWNQESE